MPTKNVNDGQLEMNPRSKENPDNAEADLKTAAPDELTAPIPKPCQHEHDEHKAKTCRETQYRDLHLRAKEDYQKLSASYLKLKQAHQLSKMAFVEQKIYINGLLYQLRKVIADMDATTLKDKYQPEVPRASSLNLLLSSFSHPASEASVSPPSEPHKADQTPDRGTGIEDAAAKKPGKDSHRSGDPADQAARKLVPLQELQAKQLTNFTQQITARECPSENDSDEPIVVSERSLKRKRPGNKQHNASNESLTNSVRVKSEPELSSPQSLAHHSLTKPNDSIDLDDFGDRTVTPRKRRRVMAGLHGEDEMSWIEKDEAGVRLLPQVAKQTNYPRSPKGRVGNDSRTPDSPLESRLSNQHRMYDSETTSGKTNRNVLGVMDSNRKMLPNLKDHIISHNCAIPIPPISHSLPSRDESHPITEPKWRAKSTSIFGDYDGEMAGERPNLPPLSSNFETGRKHGRTLSAIEALEPPISRLYPEDFILNPQHNQGLSYAFSEVTRGRDARHKCLNGCTRPDCCGGLLRKAIEIGGYTAPQPNRLSNAFNNLNVNSNENEEEQDQQLLEDYLGDLKHKIKSLPESQRKELLLQAKTAHFAKLHGKHRTSGVPAAATAGAAATVGRSGGIGTGVYVRAASGRAPTPPGFWNADMPSTQEEAENRKSADEMERRKVEQMYREAMRPSRRYLLR